MGGLFGGGEVSKTSETPLSDLNIQSSSYGNPVPLLYGRNRLPANLIDYDDFLAIPHTTKSSSGGKGATGGGMENTTYTYATSFIMALGQGPFHGINAYWKDKEYTADATAFTKALGTATQTAWPNWTTKHPEKALAYRGLAYVAAAAYDLGGSANLGNHSFDVTGLFPYNPGTIDGANPKDIITDYLTEPTHGARFPAANLGDWTAYSSWCIANGVFLSPVYDTQGEARQAITDLMRITNAGIYFSEGLLKITPYGDTAATGNGVTYTPNNTPAYALGEDDYLDLEHPVRILRTPNADAYNQVQIEFLDRTKEYNVAIETAQDQASIELYGLKPMAVIVAHAITDAATARLVAQLVLQRVLYTRNTYEFELGWKYCRLESTDYVTLTYARLGLSACPVRILSVEEDEKGRLAIEAEDAPAGVTHSPLYDSQAGAGYTVNYNVAPGNVVAPAFFETPAIKAMSGLMIGVAVNGNSADWGGAEVWASHDGTSYAYMGRVDGGARYGTLSNSITAASGQVARVALAGTPGQIFTASTQDADNLATMAALDDEFVAYTTATLIGAGLYDLTLPVRAAYSTTAAIHAAGAKFIRIDDAIAYSDALDLPMIGKTVYFKFASFNKWGGGKQLLADVDAYPYTITGVMAKLPPPAIYGLAVESAAHINIVSWNNPADATTDRVEVWCGATSEVGSAQLAGSVIGPVGIFTDNVGAGGVTYYYWVRAINKQQYPSAYVGPQSGTTGTISVTLADGSVTTVKLATGAVTATKIEDGAISSPKIAANAVTAAAIAANAIVAEKIAADAVTAAKIKAGEISTNHLGANVVTAEKIDARGLSIKDASGNVILAAGTPLAYTHVAGLGDLAVQDTINWNTQIVNIPLFGNFAWLSSISAANISTYIAAGAIGTAYIADGNITAAKIGTAQIDTLRIAGNAVTIQQVAAGGNSATISHNCSGGSVIILALAGGQQFFSSENGYEGNMTMTVSVDGGIVVTMYGVVSSSGGALAASATWMVTPGAGWHTFSVSRFGDSNNGPSCRIAILEAKR